MNREEQLCQQEREELRDLLCKVGVRIGEVVLASGERSRYFIDTKAVLLSLRGFYLVGSVLMAKLVELSQELNITQFAVGGTELGSGTIITSLLAQPPRDGLEIVSGFLVRRRWRANGPGHSAVGPRLRRGTAVVIIDEVTTAGNSLMSVLDYVHDVHLSPTVALCLVDRCEGADDVMAGQCPFYSVFTAEEILTAHQAIPLFPVK